MADEIIDFALSGNVMETLEAMKKASERTVLRRIAMQALEPMRDEVKARAPYEDGDLRESYVIGTNLTGTARKAVREEPTGGVRVYLGSANRKAVPLEFGSLRARAIPHFRPAYEAKARVTIDFVIDNLETEVMRTADRAARRGAKKL